MDPDVQDVLKNKKIERCNWIATPLDDNWDYIYEHKDKGVSYRCFYDSSDKIVFTPNHITEFSGQYDHDPCEKINWKEDKDHKTLDKIWNILVKVGHHFVDKGYKSIMVTYSGTPSGYLNTYFDEILDLSKNLEKSERPYYTDNSFCLFVFCKEEDNILE